MCLDTLSPIDQVNLNIIKSMTKKIHYPLGYSDNGSNNLVPVIAVALGAKVIEKHFTLNKKMKGPDHSISCDPKQLKEIILQTFVRLRKCLALMKNLVKKVN